MLHLYIFPCNLFAGKGRLANRRSLVCANVIAPSLTLCFGGAAPKPPRPSFVRRRKKGGRKAPCALLKVPSPPQVACAAAGAFSALDLWTLEISLAGAERLPAPAGVDLSEGFTNPGGLTRRPGFGAGRDTFRSAFFSPRILPSAFLVTARFRVYGKPFRRRRPMGSCCRGVFFSPRASLFLGILGLVSESDSFRVP